MNAILSAHHALIVAAQCLDRRQPVKEDLANALENASEAVRLLKASLVLIESGIYIVGDEPVASGPLFAEEEP